MLLLYPNHVPPPLMILEVIRLVLTNYFETTLSVDEFKVYKPHAEVYQKALSKLGVSPHESLMVAAHGWDIAGALAAGMQAGFY